MYLGLFVAGLDQKLYEIGAQSLHTSAPDGTSMSSLQALVVACWQGVVLMSLGALRVLAFSTRVAHVRGMAEPIVSRRQLFGVRSASQLATTHILCSNRNYIALSRGLFSGEGRAREGARQFDRRGHGPQFVLRRRRQRDDHAEGLGDVRAALREG